MTQKSKRNKLKLKTKKGEKNSKNTENEVTKKGEKDNKLPLQDKPIYFYFLISGRSFLFSYRL